MAKVDGKKLAESILTSLAETVRILKSNNKTPSLAVILVGDDQASLSYIKQKNKAAVAIGATLKLIHLPSDTTATILKDTISQCNKDQTIDGFIVQRPLPVHLHSYLSLLDNIHPEKDIDGFVPNSPYIVPVAAAVFTILGFIFHETEANKTIGESSSSNGEFQIFDLKFVTQLVLWLQTKKICIIGRGSTAGKPIADLFQKYNCTTSIVSSHTTNANDVIIEADIVVSCVGKANIITPKNCKKGAILISVGLWKDTDGKLQGDYNEEEIAGVASWYTPTPGGVGPLNVACLMQNMTIAAKKNI